MNPEFEIKADERKLVNNLSKGNLIAFNILFKEYSGRLYGFAYGYLKSRPESEELVQEVFTKIWEKRTDLRSDLSFKSFLFTIAFNLIKKHFIRRARMVNYFSNTVYDDIDLRTSDSINYESVKQYILDLVNRLPEKQV